MTGSGADWSAAKVLTEHFLDVTRSNGRTVTRPYLTGRSSLGVPPQPASDWSRDGQLVGGEVPRLLLRVCGSRERERRGRSHNLAAAWEGEDGFHGNRDQRETRSTGRRCRGAADRCGAKVQEQTQRAPLGWAQDRLSHQTQRHETISSEATPPPAITPG